MSNTADKNGLLVAFLKAQSEFPSVAKTATNPAFRSKYATLGDVMDAAFPVLHKHGLVVMQAARTDVTEHGLMVYVMATLYHAESGESIAQELGAPTTKQDAQGIGSALSYLRRYTLMTLLGLVADDDDGAKAEKFVPRVEPKTATNGRIAQPEPVVEPEMPSENLSKQFHATGTELYPAKGVWDKKRPGLVAWVTGKRTSSSKELTADEMLKLIEIMNDKLRAAPAAQPALAEEVEIAM